MKILSLFTCLLAVLLLSSCNHGENIVELGKPVNDDGGSGLGSGNPDDPDGDGDPSNDTLSAAIQVIVDEYLGSYTATNVREVFGSDCNEVSFTVTQNGRVLSISTRVYRCQGNTRDTGYPLEVTVGDDGNLYMDGVVVGSITADVLSVDDFHTYGNCTTNDFAITLIDAANSGVFDYMCNTQYTFLGDL